MVCWQGLTDAGAAGARARETAVADRAVAEVILAWAGPLARHRDRHAFTGALPPPPVTGTRLLHARRNEALVPLPSVPAGLRAGRWYPNRMLGPRRIAIPGTAPGFRLSLDPAGRPLADFNHPLAGVPVTVSHRGFPAAPAGAGFGAGHPDLALMAAAGGPGLQAAPGSGGVDYGSDMGRDDEDDDGAFYARPRPVDHLDAEALRGLREVHGRLLRPGTRILDLMASWNSHLPDLDLEVDGLGMNAEELAANPRLGRRVVQDLNRCPALPWGDAAFDAVLCSLSIEYLCEPRTVVREAARVLKPGGLFVASFSGRWFPPKVTRLWLDLQPFERLGWVLGLLAGSGAFAALQAETRRGWPRPAGDRHIGTTPLSDPLFVCWGLRSPA